MAPADSAGSILAGQSLVLKLRFISAVNTRYAGPQPLYRIEGPQLFAYPARMLIALHEGNTWHMGDEQYHRVESDGPVLITGEGCAPSNGVSRQGKGFSMYDGVAFLDHEIFATFDAATRTWLFPRKQEECAALVISAAS